jgi:two-component system, chemotaxis family, CheB/CheR fusion protein
LQRFFSREGDYYRIRREVRDVVLFSEHNVLRDPPFSRLDLITCRNLLIYLDWELQKSVFDIFHYALNLGAYLFLGSAETAEKGRELFQPVDKTHRLYQARPWPDSRLHVPSLPLNTSHMEGPAPLAREKRRRLHPLAVPPDQQVVLETQHRQSLEEYGPPSVLVDDNYHVLHISDSAGRYLLHPRGPLSSNLLQLVRPELQAELRAALSQAFARGKAIVSSPINVQFNGHSRQVTLSVRLRPQPSGEAQQTGEPAAGRRDPGARAEALVLFLEHANRVPEAGGSAPEPGRRVAELESELQRLRERMQVTAEQHELAAEELKAANEELQSMNEEYRSTTEELETSKEELQSVNEELQTVNNELKNKLDEISRAHSDLENLMQATRIATLFLDRDLHIRHYTPAAEALFNIRPTDRGRPIGDLTHHLEYDDLVADAREVLRTLVAVQREVVSRPRPDKAMHCFLVRLQPYRTMDDRIDGLVITLVNITDLKNAEQAVRQAKQFNEKIVNTVREGLLVLKPDLTVEFANESFYQMFQANERQTVGQKIYSLRNGHWDTPELRRLLEEVLPQESVFNDYRVEHEYEQLGRRVMRLNARRLDHLELILLAIEDITEREQYEQERALNEVLEEQVRERTREVETLAAQLTMAEQEERDRIAQILHDDLQQQLYGVQIQLAFLQGAVRQEAALLEIEEMGAAVETAITTARRLSVDLSPPILAEEGLAEAIRWLAEQMEAQYGLQVALKADDSFPVPDVDKRVLLFQIVRESLFNVLKHAGVQSATVMLARTNGEYQIDVVDEGSGFEPEYLGDAGSQGLLPVDGSGLQRARERLRFIGGRLEFEAAPGAGTRVKVLAPV